MELNALVNAVTGNTQLAVATSLLKKSQDLPAQQVAQLMDSVAKTPSPPGVGQKIDISG